MLCFASCRARFPGSPRFHRRQPPPVVDICAVTGHSPQNSALSSAPRRPCPACRRRKRLRSGMEPGGKRGRGMDDRAIEELCKWHDEQVARLESQDATAGTARAIEMHAKTSVALLEAMAEIRRLRSDCRAGRQRLRCGNQHQVRPQHQPEFPRRSSGRWRSVRSCSWSGWFSRPWAGCRVRGTATPCACLTARPRSHV